MVLRNPRALSFFEKFLKRTLREEILACWQLIQEYKTLKDEESLLLIATQIITRFCTVGSSEEVNAATQAKEAVKVGNSFPVEKFKPLEEEIWNILRLDGWYNYIQSDEFSLCIEEKVPTKTYIECPEEFDGVGFSLFLGGGISGCPDWQGEIRPKLLEKCPHLVLFNPRRAIFNVQDTAIASKQITWEHEHLRRASAIIFWFPCETLCPITLYELGAWTILAGEKHTKIFVGCHPKYQRKLDVEVQTKLVANDIPVVDDLDKLVDVVHSWYKSLPM